MDVYAEWRSRVEFRLFLRKLRWPKCSATPPGYVRSHRGGHHSQCISVTTLPWLK